MAHLDLLAALVLLLLGAGLLALLAIPLMLVLTLAGLAFKAAVLLLLFPIRILGWLLGLGVAAFGFLLKGFVVVGFSSLLILAGLLPLMPILLLGLVIYFLVRSSPKRLTSDVHGSPK